MLCFHHADRDAVAVCPGCGKALCPACTRSGKFGRQLCSEACGVRLEKIDRVEESGAVYAAFIPILSYSMAVVALGATLVMVWVEGGVAATHVLQVGAGVGFLIAAYWTGRPMARGG